MRSAVVGHVEWVEFVRVPSHPTAGEIVHATEWWEEPGGGGAAAAVQLLKLAGECTFFTALGEDERGWRAHAHLSSTGLNLEIAWRSEPTRRAITHIAGDGERTITVLGDRLAPSGRDSLEWALFDEIDAVYFTAGDRIALAHARRADVLVASARSQATLAESDVRLDALVGSAVDPGETYRDGDLDPPPELVVQTHGADGATWRARDGRSGAVPAPALPGPIVDRYGAGDSFAAGLTYALALGSSPDEAVALAARCGAAVITGRGPYERQPTADDL